MISELDETIRQVFITEGGLDPAEIDVSFDLPNREWSGSISRPTINCYLFDIQENRGLRDEGWETERRNGGSTIVRRRPALRYNLTYLITAWTRAVEDEHRLLWHALQTLARMEVMPEAQLQGRLREHGYPIYTTVARSDGAIRSTDFWTALENHLKPSLTYVVTLALERDAVPAGPPVLSSGIRVLPREGGGENDGLHGLGGSLRDRAGAPVAGALVELVERGMQATTDAEGHFTLHRLAAGRYTLVARDGARETSRSIEVPGQNYDLTLE
ncbi:MAG: hypothetical protein OHK0022_13960 [Roseiflexaceae bacterium]